ncbi:hypothetical protein ZMO1_ZMOp33x033 (plasmid) [Zymomonas mobilis subsp. mobilis ZM4 = ATCC 31821]|uniref:hypothetical protein n=1 Tax=Zymomonas mobilis TaxID=542 RepID=UPI000A962EE7|nr:hypothetical protein [Zymomonas mobilis]AVZ26850.1 hypothetical protein ZMO2_ZMOp33x033 [Zymomonas mobilis subsp. mobilis]AVZ28736.1 hypothetical protein ZMO3_ZMOp33x033 [Zymomonas mobilis subsp. mobilis]AVZ43182.1 hypothetical protein ZMO1_ZMOp33x033 [Zymomonas mobilis subsp. mobilis ZM4 = ATCC 31821]UBQ08730.1 hypothetical protein LB319_09625 [Zymomonas mobilis]
MIKPFIKGSKRFHFLYGISFSLILCTISLFCAASEEKTKNKTDHPQESKSDKESSQPKVENTEKDNSQSEDTPKKEDSEDGKIPREDELEHPSKDTYNKSHWYYRDNKDEMRNSMTHIAMKISLNNGKFPYPYRKDTKAAILLSEKSNDELKVVFSVDGGDILCNLEKGYYFSVKFDDGETKNFSCSYGEGNMRNMVFIDQDVSFLSQLKNSKKTIIEAQFLGIGTKQFVFNTRDLNF